MSEEKVTIIILNWLKQNGWKIVSYDFPQSGTGIRLKKNGADGEKNKGSIVPDIIAIKKNKCVFFENKDRYYYLDYKKVEALRFDNQYTDSIHQVLSSFDVNNLYYGIGMPFTKYKGQAKDNCEMTDFIVTVTEDGSIKVVYDIKECFNS